jgi:hypothetical protein
MPARIQLFELKTTYEFETQANIDKYLFPYLQYQNFLPPLTVDGVLGNFFQSRAPFFQAYSELLTNKDIQDGDGTNSYSFTLAGNITQGNALMRGFKNYPSTTLEQTLPGIYVTGTTGAGVQLVLQDDGAGNFTGDGTGTINYSTGAVSVTFSSVIPSTEKVRAQFYLAQTGTPRYILFYDNYFTIRPIPFKPFLIKGDAYLTPTAFLDTSESLAFEYMDDYIARGASQRILSDLGDWEQYNAYERLFKQQEAQVLRRTNRQQSTQRAATIFANQVENQGMGFYTNY